MTPSARYSLISKNIPREQLFPIGSWWLYRGEIVSSGDTMFGAQSSSPHTVYFYPLPQNKNEAKRPQVVANLSYLGAIGMLFSGTLKPYFPDDLSCWSKLEREYYRNA